MTYVRKEVLAEGVVVYEGDCLDVRHELGVEVDAVIADPPYGQKLKVNTFHAGGTRDKAVVQRNGKSLTVRPNVHKPVAGDERPFDPQPWVKFAPRTVLWGAHKFADRLPPGTWLVWDKVPTGKVRDQGDGEAAWMFDDPPRPLRIYRLLWDGLCVGVGARHEVTAGQQRLHPTQKPEVLMAWTIEQANVPQGGVILDPYMGSGSTGVAAVKAGYRFIGIELDADHFDTACRRISAALQQTDLLVSIPKPAVQLNILDGAA